MSFLLKLLFFVSVFSISYGARILGVFFVPSYSHQIVYHPIYRELSKRGHEVIAITPNPLNDSSLTNLTEIDVHFLYEKYHKTMVDSLVNAVTYAEVLEIGTNLVNNFVEDILKNTEFKKLYQNAENEKFDLVLVEGFSLILPAIGHVFKAPTIGVCSMPGSLDKYSSMGGIIHPAIYGAPVLDIEYPIPLWQKITNVYNFLWHKYHTQYIQAPIIDQLTRTYFGKDFPSILELEKNISMYFMNKNSLMSSVRPTPPNIVMLDFMHIQEPKPLPKDLEQILNNSTQGVVYFSLGSNVKSSTLPPPIRNAIIEGLSSLPYTVLWKWESDEVPGVRENVITRKWFPQQDVLAHPNIKVFVTQGGLQSSEEAIMRSIPMVGIPAMADQDDNVNKLVKLGLAVKLSLNDLTSDSLKHAIIEVAENTKYLKKIKEVAAVAMDQPMTGIERAVWWSEYVIRNKGAPALRSVLADVPLYEYLMLDVIAVVLVVIVVSFIVFRALVTFLLSLLTVYKKRKLE